MTPEAEAIIQIDVPVGAIVVVVAFLTGLPFAYILFLKFGKDPLLKASSSETLRGLE